MEVVSTDYDEDPMNLIFCRHCLLQCPHATLAFIFSKR